MTTRPIPKQAGKGWDEHRNTSRVFQVPPDALPAALRALRGVEPELRRWITEGHPRLTSAERRERFGEPYRVTRTKR